MLRFLPFLDLRSITADDVRRDVMAALAVTFLSVPQGVAYAVIAGLPPVMGLYAGTLPAIFGALFRSSRSVVIGPTNAISLLVGTAIAAHSGSPLEAAVALALVVGGVQILAGLFSLGALVDYISTAVVTGYIAGAGILIGVGQLPNVTNTPGAPGTLVDKVVGWVQQLSNPDPLAVGLALGTAGALVLLDRFAPRAPAGILAMAAGIGLSWALDLGGRGLPLVRDLAPVPQGLPPLTIPDPALLGPMFSAGLAVAVLSLIESSAVARASAARSGERLDVSADFAGTGLANLAAAFFGAYPVSGSLSRSALNEAMGSRTRLAGALSGLMLLGVLLVAGPLVDLTPVASLAGVLLIIAVKLVDVAEIRRILASSWGDRLAFLATLVGTFTLPLDQAIFLGVGISLVMFLRRARLLVVKQLGLSRSGRMREQTDHDGPDFGLCPAIRLVHVEGSLFFGAANELRAALERHADEPGVMALIVRLKRAHDLDYTTAAALQSVHDRLEGRGQSLYLVGMTPSMMEALQRSGVAEALGQDHLFPTRPTWFAAMNAAISEARDFVAQRGADVEAVDAYLSARADPSTTGVTRADA